MQAFLITFLHEVHRLFVLKDCNWQ